MRPWKIAFLALLVLSFLYSTYLVIDYSAEASGDSVYVEWTYKTPRGVVLEKVREKGNVCFVATFKAMSDASVAIDCRY
jgi:hypothetical protein